MRLPFYCLLENGKQLRVNGKQMRCLYCGSETRVTNSRSQKKLNQTWRRRACTTCQAVFTTLELADFNGSLLYKKDFTSIEPFSRDKLFISIYEACKHRKDAHNVATALTATIINKLVPEIHQASLKRTQIVKAASGVLKRFDRAAATHYEVYHPL